MHPDSSPDTAPEPGEASLSTTIYGELHALAARHLAHERRDHTLQPTALVHEAYLRISSVRRAGDRGRRAYFALAGRTMRAVLVDHARRRNAKKRQSGDRAELTTSISSPEGSGLGDATDVLALDEAIERLAGLDPQLVEIVDLMFFAGLTAGEAADVLDVSSRTVERGWRTARAFLRQVLSETPDSTR